MVFNNFYNDQPFTLIGSVFRAGWLSSPSEWNNPDLAAKFEAAKDLRDLVLKSLDNARSSKLIRSSLEADVFIQMKDAKLRDWINSLFDTELQHNYSLSDFLIVSKATVSSDELPNVFDHKETREIKLGGKCYSATVGVARSGGSKCPRCWRYDMCKDDLCNRCMHVMEQA